jgi:hypothetical protein
MLTVLFLLFLSPCGFLALDLQSTLKTTIIRNGTQGNQTEWQQRTLTIRCDQNSPRDPGLQIGDLFYDINCSPPKYTIETTLRKFVPYRTKLFAAELWVLPLSATFELPAFSFDELTGRRRLLDFSPGNFFVQDVFCPAPVLHAAPGCNGKPPPDGAGLDAKTINDWIAQVKADTAFKVALQPWIGNVSLFIQEQGTINTNMDLVLKGHTDMLNTLNNMSLTLNNSINAVAASATASLQKLENDTKTIYATLDAGLNALTSYTDAKVQQLENTTRVNFQSVINVTNSLIRNQTVNQRLITAKQHTTEKMIRDLAGTISRQQSKDNIRRLQSVQAHRLAQQAVSQGYNAFWHPDHVGKPPVITSPTERTLLVESLNINAINGSSPLTAHQWTIDFLCNAAYIINQDSLQPDYTEFLSMVGPINCTSLPGEKADNCRCWLEISHKKCQPATTPVDFNWQQITSNTRADYVLTADNQCAHSSPPVASDYDGRKFDDMALFHAFLGDICNLNLAAPTGLSGTRLFQTVGKRSGRNNFPSPDNRLSVCGIDLQYIFESNQATSNLVHAVYQYWILGFYSLLGDEQVYVEKTYGLIPSFMNYETNEFQKGPDNRTYTVYRMAFTAVDTATRPVYSTRPVGFEPLVTSTAYAEPPVCTNLGCSFGTPVTTERTSSLQASAPFDYLLPTAGRGIIGELKPGGSPGLTTTSVFDAPEDSVSTSVGSFDQEGKITYVWQMIPAGYNISTQPYTTNPAVDFPATALLDQWQTANFLPFNAFKGYFSAQIVEVPFSSSRCTIASDVTEQWLCGMLDEWLIDSHTNMRNGRLVLTPRQWSYTVTLNIIDGEIKQRVFAGCPDFDFKKYEDGTTELQLWNSLQTPVTGTIQFDVTDPTACESPGDISYDLLPSQTTYKTIVACGETIISVFSIGENGVPIQCKQSLNITLVPLSSANIRRFLVDSTNRSYVSDEIVARATTIQQTALDTLQAIIPFLITDFHPTLTATERNDAIQNIISAYNLTLQTNKNAAGLAGFQTPTDAIAESNRQFNALAAQFANQSVVNVERINILDDSIAIQQGTISNIVVLTADVQDKLNKSIDANNRLSVDLYHELAKAGNHGNNDPCAWCNNNLPDFIATFICPIICPIIDFFISIGEIILYVLIIAAILAICFPVARAFIPWFLKAIWGILSCKAFSASQAAGGATVTTTALTGVPATDLVNMQRQIDQLQAALNTLKNAPATTTTTTKVGGKGFTFRPRKQPETYVEMYDSNQVDLPVSFD